MINVLIIDDDNERIRKIAASIKGDDINVEYVMTKNEALCRLEESKYDLVIIDIMLPENIDSVNPQPTAGIDIIKDIYQKYNKPSNSPIYDVKEETQDENKTEIKETIMQESNAENGFEMLQRLL